MADPWVSEADRPVDSEVGSEWGQEEVSLTNKTEQDKARLRSGG